MFVFGNDKGARGCYISFNVHNGFKRGAYLQLPDGTELKQDSSDPYIVTGLSFAQKEKYQLVQCFEDTVHTYAFGHDPTSSLISVEFTGFMIAKGGEDYSALFDNMFMAYYNNRISMEPRYSYVYMGSRLIGGFLVGMQSSTADPMHNLQKFSLDLLAVEVHI